MALLLGATRRRKELRCSPPFSAAFAADRLGKIGGAGAEEQERADQEVHGHGGVAGFHLCHSGLAGLEALSQLNL